MIDLHAHILPGMDDGASDISESIAMARVASGDGIKTIAATPHVLQGVFDNGKDEILSAVEKLNKTLREQNIAINILPGAEYNLETDLPHKLARGELLTINNNGRYLLVELPSVFLPGYTAQILYEIQLQGVIPIIAHPERNSSFINRPAALKEMISRGILAQITSASITGLFGKRVQQTAFSFLKQGLVHLVSSDAHSSRGRAPLLSRAYQEIEKHMDRNYAEQIVCQNPYLIIKGESVDRLPGHNNSNWWKLFFKRASSFF
jgi:protein-tyrosine phosphatase